MPTDADDVEGKLKLARTDFEEEQKKGGDFNHNFGASIPWNDSVTERIRWAYKLQPREAAESWKHSIGPTYISVWKTGYAIYYLEIHLES